MKKTIRIVVAAVLFGSALLAVLPIYFPSYALKVFGDSRQEITRTAVVELGRQYETASFVFLFRRATVQVSYPEKILENLAVPIKIKYFVHQVPVPNPTYSSVTPHYTEPDKPTEYKKLDAKISIKVESSGFTIQPDDPVEFSQNTPLPIEDAWTITAPSGSAGGTILVKLNEENISGVVYDRQFVLNEEAMPITKDGYYELNIGVVTYWGVSNQVVVIVGGILSILGFILTLQVIEPLLSRFFIKS